MKHRIAGIISHPLITGSSVIFIGSFVANIVNYVFNLMMGRMLSVADYGLLITLSSLFILLSIFQLGFSNVVVKLTAENDQEGDQLKSVLLTGSKIIGGFSLALFLILLLSLPLLSSFLHIDQPVLIILTIAAIFFSLLYSLPAGFLQGKMRFYLLSALTIMQPIIKLIVAVGLAFIGFEILAPLVGIFLASLTAIVVGVLIVVKNVGGLKTTALKNETKIRKEFVHYSYTYFLAGIGMTILSNSDVIMVRHFLTPIEAGHYAALSLMGKAIFYFTAPINFVFFPLIAQKRAKKERLFETVVLALGIVVLASVAISFVYFLFPGLVLAIFFPKPEYKVLAPLLGIFSLYVLLFSVTSLFNNFFLSIGKTKIYIFTIVAGLLQILGIFLYHGSLYQVIGVLFAVNFLLLLAFLLYYLKHGKD